MYRNPNMQVIVARTCTYQATLKMKTALLHVQFKSGAFSHSQAYYSFHCLSFLNPKVIVYDINKFLFLASHLLTNGSEILLENRNSQFHQLKVYKTTKKNPSNAEEQQLSVSTSCKSDMSQRWMVAHVYTHYSDGYNTAIPSALHTLNCSILGSSFHIWGLVTLGFLASTASSGWCLNV